MSTDSQTVKLQYPFEWTEGETISEITIERPKAAHMRGLNIQKLESETDEMFKLVQKLVGQPPRFIDKIDFSDMQAIMGVVSSFLGNGPQTGPIA